MVKYGTLTAKQKKLVREYISENPNTYQVEDIEYDRFIEIFDLYPSEFFHSAVNRYLDELVDEWNVNA